MGLVAKMEIRNGRFEAKCPFLALSAYALGLAWPGRQYACSWGCGAIFFPNALFGCLNYAVQAVVARWIAAPTNDAPHRDRLVWPNPGPRFYCRRGSRGEAPLIAPAYRVLVHVHTFCKAASTSQYASSFCELVQAHTP